MESEKMSEALRLADELVAPVGTQSTYSVMQQAAAELRRLHAECDALRADYGNACKLVVDMHAAATGRPGEGPRLGVVEDVAAVRAECESLRADAERYRWLRDPANAYRDEWNYFGPYSSEAEIDAVIDAARAALKEVRNVHAR